MPRIQTAIAAQMLLARVKEKTLLLERVPKQRIVEELRDLMAFRFYVCWKFQSCGELTLRWC